MVEELPLGLELGDLVLLSSNLQWGAARLSSTKNSRFETSRGEGADFINR